MNQNIKDSLNPPRNIVFSEEHFKYIPEENSHNPDIPDWVWARRNFIWESYDKKLVLMDFLGWMDTIPYKISRHIGRIIEKKFRNVPTQMSFLQLGCGCGGSLVQFSKTLHAPSSLFFKICGIEKDEKRLEICASNLDSYGIKNKIEKMPEPIEKLESVEKNSPDICGVSLFLGDAKKIPSGLYDITFVSPPRYTYEDIIRVDASLYFQALRLSSTSTSILHFPYMPEELFIRTLDKLQIYGNIFAEIIFVNSIPWGIIAYTGKFAEFE